MWIAKKITLLNDPQLPTGTVLTRETLAEHQQALDILQLAGRQAQARLDDAERQAETLLADAEARFATEIAEQKAKQQQDFLTASGQLFSDWQAQQQQWQAGLLPHAEALLAQAMNQLLAELPPPDRLRAMLQQLLKAQGRQANATLLCPPQQQADAEAWLAQHPHLGWELSCDAALPDESLVLTTEKGELHLSWTQLCQALLPPSSPSLS
ncbi:hypothetical protein NG99_18255 [Erwinia typographi]|uniref:Type III secretion system protein n=1 Tax=Erwinia typographi TaxID=371042 RepID=A0A0A3YY66_9GAMM|nr:type III secretion system stator protein SctL [Erwinia typographi]KGT90336.1 hypothetical protein NG99_18255 [Erwinia typographi]